jgi:putative sigma-54 modulation protein
MTRKSKALDMDLGYKVHVTGRNVQVTEALRNYAIEKIAKLERFASRIIDVAITMDMQKIQNKVDIVMRYGSVLIKSQASTTDMYVSVDQAVDKLEAQIKKYLTKIHDYHNKAHHEVRELEETVYEAEVPDIVDESDANDQMEEETKRSEFQKFMVPRIVKTETQSLNILNHEEAIMKMDLSKAKVLVYRGEDDRKLKVIYRRDDGNFGVIKAEA